MATVLQQLQLTHLALHVTTIGYVAHGSLQPYPCISFCLGTVATQICKLWGKHGSWRTQMAFCFVFPQWSCQPLCSLPLEWPVCEVGSYRILVPFWFVLLQRRHLPLLLTFFGPAVGYVAQKANKKSHPDGEEILRWGWMSLFTKQPNSIPV